MKAVFILLDSLNRRFLSAYSSAAGNDAGGALTPNIDRLASRSVIFDNHWCGSAPCMPARRDIMTGRLNFLERPWGGIEPFDQPLAQILKTKNVYTHMETDHYHYSERGGENYWGAFTSWQLHRGAENDTILWGPDKTGIPHPPQPDNYCGVFRPSYEKIREANQGRKERYSTSKVFSSAAEWLEKNKDADNYMLWVEGFDPHEPFDVPEEFLRMYTNDCADDGSGGFWPNYKPNDNFTGEQIAGFITHYKALVSMADYNLGKILDVLEKNNMFDDTLVVLTTDHGFMLGEHGFLGKNYMPDYNEIFHIPLMVAAPGVSAGRCSALTQNIDFYPTFLEWFGADPSAWTNPLHGRSLIPLLRGKSSKVRDAALFGMFGKTVSMTDGDYVYSRAAKEGNQPLNIYAAMPTLLNRYLGYGTINEEDYGSIQLGSLRWTTYPVYKIPSSITRADSASLNFTRINQYIDGSKLYSLKNDYAQTSPIDDEDLEQRYIEKLIETMRLHDAPEEQFIRLGLDQY